MTGKMMLVLGGLITPLDLSFLNYITLIFSYLWFLIKFK